MAGVPGPAEESSPKGGASLGLEKAPNGRDLGGYLTRDGRTVVAGQLLRTEALSRLTAQDLAVLAGLGVRTVVDFRGEAEVGMSGPDLLPSGCTNLHLPVFAADHDIYVTLGALFTGGDESEQRRVLGDGGAERIMEDMYRWFVSDPAARAPYAQTLKRVADAGERPVLFHCTAGKDRTGWMGAIILTALGVPEETVFADYLLTNERQASLLDLFTGPDSVIDPELVRPLLDVRESYLRAAFDQVSQDFGTFRAFVEDGLGGDIEDLKSQLLE